MSEDQSAFTQPPKPGVTYPAYVNIRHTLDGNVIITVREENNPNPSAITITFEEYLDLLQAEAQVIPKIMAQRAALTAASKILPAN